MSALSVAQFVEFLNTAMSTAVFPEGAVIEGEVTEYRVSQGKWIWFLLKDEEATISCFATVWQLRTPLEDGMQVRIQGKPKVHPRSGKFSVNVDAVELVGEGALRRAFELLKQKLSEAGLFAEERKRAIPRFPSRIGLITSGESAAYTDFLRILGNRWGGVEVDHMHVQVQGKDAVDQIVGAFAYFNAHPELADVLVLTRGGGSMEDLQAFNSEEVARAVFGSAVPVVVGVGHERDETLADYVADVRASTPSNAAERVVPDRAEIMALIDGWMRGLATEVDAAVGERIGQVDRHVLRLEAHAHRRMQTFRDTVGRLSMAFGMFASGVATKAATVDGSVVRIKGGISRRAEAMRLALGAKERMLKSLDPRAVLKRGYAVVRAGERILTDATSVDIGERIQVQLRRGSLDAEVKKKI